MICENFAPFRHSLRFDKRDETSRKITAQLEQFFGMALTSKMTSQKDFHHCIDKRHLKAYSITL